MSRYAMSIQALRMRRNDTAVGGPLWHTVDDRAKMVKQMATAFAQVHNEAMMQMGWTPDHPTLDENDARWQWYKAAAIPVLNEWEKFRTELLGSWWERFTTNWDIIQSWQERLLSFREMVAAKFDIASPAPPRLTQTMWQDAGSAMSNIGAGVAGTLKTLLYVAVIGGLAVLFIFALKGGGKTTAIALRGVAK